MTETSDHDLTVPPWALEGHIPTAEEWLPWYDSLPEAKRLPVAASLLDAAQRGDLCWQADHAGYPAQLDALRRVDRLRTAWRSARRRARQQADAMDRLFGDRAPALSLVLDETRETVGWDHPASDPAQDLHNAVAAVEHAYDLTAPGDPLPDSWWSCPQTDETTWPRPVHTAGPCPDLDA